MPVDTKHPDYSAHVERWAKCRTAVEGECAVKEQGELYLPRLSSDVETSDDDYMAYKKRASFYGASGRTVNGLAGAIMAKPASVNFPESRADELKFIGASNESLEQVLRECIEEDLSIGRLGLFLDAAPESQTPYIAIYCAESITNWKEAVIDGRLQPTMVTLKEEYSDPDPDDIWEPNCGTQYRVLELKVGKDGVTRVYTQQLWRRDETQGEGSKKTWQPYGDEIIPRKRGGKPLNYIPFKFVNPADLRAAITKSPIEDLVDVNLSHYRNSADLEHGTHFTALPTAWAAGFDLKKGTRLAIGSAVAWVSSSPQAKAGYLEFTGQGLGHLLTLMERKEKLMAILGARLLEDTKKAAEAAETLRIRQGSERSILSNIAATVSEAMTQMLRWYAEWTGISETADISVELNADFDLSGMTPQMLQTLFTVFQSGGMSYTTFFYNLEAGEMFPDGHTLETEMELIEKGPPIGLLPPAGGAGSEGESGDSESDEGEEAEGDEG